MCTHICVLVLDIVSVDGIVDTSRIFRTPLTSGRPRCVVTT